MWLRAPFALLCLLGPRSAICDFAVRRPRVCVTAGLVTLATTSAFAASSAHSAEWLFSSDVPADPQEVSVLQDRDGPPTVPHAGASVLKSVDEDLKGCIDGGSGSSKVSLSTVGGLDAEGRQKRKSFVCTAQCAAREPQLEKSLAPWASWDTNSSGDQVLETMMDFCKSERSCTDPFVIFALWKDSVHVRTCGGTKADGSPITGGGKGREFKDPSFYLIGPEDLSLNLVLLLGVQRVAAMPKGPVVFGMYLSDYTCLGDRHLIGPGIPIFSYLTRETSWTIPWPSSFTLASQWEVEKWNKKKSKKALLAQGGQQAGKKDWAKRKARAYWIGTITGPWEVVPDAALMAIPRLNLLKISSDNPDQVQADWSGMAGYGISWIKSDKNVSGFGGSRPRSVVELTGKKKVGRSFVDDWDNYKYYLNIDGVVMGGRLNKLAALGGVILQHQSGYYENIDALLNPGEHYLPIEYDLSDLVSKVKWLQRNDEKAQRMAEKAKSLAEQRMRFEDQICYIWRALEALGHKTSGRAVDDDKFGKMLDKYNFKKVDVEDGGMRATLEKFWGDKDLEEVATGGRVMTAKGIELIQHVWDRLSGLWGRAHHPKNK